MSVFVDLDAVIPSKAQKAKSWKHAGFAKAIELQKVSLKTPGEESLVHLSVIRPAPMPRAEFKLKGYLKNISVGEHVKHAEIFFNDTWKAEARAAATSPVKAHKSIGCQDAPTHPHTQGRVCKQ